MENAQELSESLISVADSHSLALFITFSRRTPHNVKEYFQEKFPWPNICYDPESGEPNPYPAILGSAEFIVSTPDSISMCSEAASTGKPIYIYRPDNFTLKKHKFWIIKSYSHFELFEIILLPRQRLHYFSLRKCLSNTKIGHELT